MYGMYLRKSRSDNITETIEDTLHKHELILYDLANSLNIDKKEIITFKEVVSGENISNRPLMQELLKHVSNGDFKGVLVVDSQRLARGDTLDQGIIIRAFSLSNTKIITPVKIIDPQNEYDQEYFEFDLFMSRREYKMITKRMQRGRYLALKEGYYVFSIPPFGYSRIKLDKGYTLVINENEYNTFNIMKNLALQGIKATKIANYLNDLNIKPRNSNTWSKSSIETILLNETNLGLVKWDSRKIIKVYKDNKIMKTRPRNKNYQTYPGKHPAIITKEEYEIIKSFINKTNKINNKTLKNPLASIITCSYCGKKMIRRPYQNHCDMLICTTPKCPNVASNLSTIEKTIIKAITNELQNFNKYVIDYPVFDLIKNNLNQEIINTKNQLSKIYELLENNTYTIEQFHKRKEILENKLIKLTNEQENIIIPIQKTIPKLDRAISLYWQANIKEKNTILKSLISKCTYKKEQSARWNKDNLDNFILEITFKH